MPILESHLAGRWVAPAAATTPLLNPATEEVLAHAGTPVADFAAALAHARAAGPALRALTFAERGELLRALSQLIYKNRDELIGLAIRNGGNTRGDAKFDIDGASGTLAAYADLGKSLGAERLLVEGSGEGVQLGRSARYHGLHVWTPRLGAAVHINAFNFPAWGLAEKAAAALLAGVPVVTKPATATALVAHRIVALAIEARILPDGALSLVAGGVGDLLDYLGPQDVLSFTGSSETARMLRSHPAVVRNSVRLNVEADSLNAALLGPDAAPGTPCWQMFLADAVKELTQKSGQKCTALRRLIVPAAHLEAIESELAERLARVRTGNPENDEVTMGPLATARQRDDVRAGMARLAAESDCVFGDHGRVEPTGVPAGKGFFVGPTVYRARDPRSARAVHEHEVFGPVATLLPYEDAGTAASLVNRGGGGLVAAIYSDDRGFLGEAALAIASHHGRILLASARLEGQTFPPGLVLASCVHGGPGRAGGGEELGGVRGLTFYLQRTALQGDRSLFGALFKGARFDPA